jgi:hypothetical protein
MCATNRVDSIVFFGVEAVDNHRMSNAAERFWPIVVYLSEYEVPKAYICDVFIMLLCESCRELVKWASLYLEKKVYLACVDSKYDMVNQALLSLPFVDMQTASQHIEIILTME